MTIGQIVLVVVGTLLLGGIVACWIFGKDYLKYSSVFSPVVSVVAQIVRTISGFSPDNSVLKDLTIVLDAAIEAAGQAEELWLDGVLEKHERAAHADNYICDILEEAGIEITDSIDSMINGAIAFVCYLLPHYSDEDEDELEDNDDDTEYEEPSSTTEEE